MQSKYEEADPLYVIAMAIGEEALGPKDFRLVQWRGGRASLLETRVSKEAFSTERFPVTVHSTNLWTQKLVPRVKSTRLALCAGVRGGYTSTSYQRS